MSKYAIFRTTDCWDVALNAAAIGCDLVVVRRVGSFSFTITSTSLGIDVQHSIYGRIRPGRRWYMTQPRSRSSMLRLAKKQASPPSSALAPPTRVCHVPSRLAQIRRYTCGPQYSLPFVVETGEVCSSSSRVHWESSPLHSTMMYEYHKDATVSQYLFESSHSLHCFKSLSSNTLLKILPSNTLLKHSPQTLSSNAFKHSTPPVHSLHFFAVASKPINARLDTIKHRHHRRDFLLTHLVLPHLL